MFEKGFDPFLMYHYDVRNSKRPAKLSSHVDQLYDLTLSYSCRLFKVKNQLFEVLAGKN